MVKGRGEVEKDWKGRVEKESGQEEWRTKTRILNLCTMTAEWIENNGKREYHYNSSLMERLRKIVELA